MDTQRSIYPVRNPACAARRTEGPLDDAGRTRFRRIFRERFEDDPVQVAAVYKDISNGLAPAGIEYYLPLFFEGMATLFDYLPENTLLVQHHNLQQAIERFWQDTLSRHKLQAGDRSRRCSIRRKSTCCRTSFSACKAAAPRADCRYAGRRRALPLPPLQVERRADNPLERLAHFVANQSGRTLLLAESLGGAKPWPASRPNTG